MILYIEFTRPSVSVAVPTSSSRTCFSSSHFVDQTTLYSYLCYMNTNFVFFQINQSFCVSNILFGGKNAFSMKFNHRVEFHFLHCCCVLFGCKAIGISIHFYSCCSSLFSVFTHNTHTHTFCLSKKSNKCHQNTKSRCVHFCFIAMQCLFTIGKLNSG